MKNHAGSKAKLHDLTPPEESLELAFDGGIDAFVAALKKLNDSQFSSLLTILDEYAPI